MIFEVQTASLSGLSPKPFGKLAASNKNNSYKILKRVAQCKSLGLSFDLIERNAYEKCEDGTDFLFTDLLNRV